MRTKVRVVMRESNVIASVLLLTLLAGGCSTSPSGNTESIDWPPPGVAGRIVGGPRVTAWDQLPRQVSPVVGYGLYSFVLFSKEPEDDLQKAKYLKTLEHLVGTVGTAEYLNEMGFDRASINITYVPVLKRQALLGLPAQDRAKRLLAVYDYELADFILSGFDRPLNNGPYFVSMRSASDVLVPAPDKVIMQDLTATTPGNIGAWVEAFVVRARQRDYAKQDALPQLLLELRNGLSVVAELGPGVIDGVNTFVDWLSPKPKN